MGPQSRARVQQPTRRRNHVVDVVRRLSTVWEPRSLTLSSKQIARLHGFTNHGQVCPQAPWPMLSFVSSSTPSSTFFVLVVDRG